MGVDGVGLEMEGGVVRSGSFAGAKVASSLSGRPMATGGLKLQRCNSRQCDRILAYLRHKMRGEGVNSKLSPGVD